MRNMKCMAFCFVFLVPKIFLIGRQAPPASAPRAPAPIAPVGRLQARETESNTLKSLKSYWNSGETVDLTPPPPKKKTKMEPENWWFCRCFFFFQAAFFRFHVSFFGGVCHLLNLGHLLSFGWMNLWIPEKDWDVWSPRFRNRSRCVNAVRDPL